MQETTRAILLRRIPLTETSLVVHWLTEGCGAVRTVARGARRGKSVFAGRLDLFYLAEIAFRRHSRGDLHTLTEARVEEAHAGIRADYGRVRTAAYFVELLEMASAPEQSAPELFDLLRRALGFLHREGAATRAVRHFENELARLLGIWTPPERGGEPGMESWAALLRACHRLPSGRRALLESLAAAEEKRNAVAQGVDAPAEGS